MGRYIVTVVETATYDIPVNAADADEACEAAEEKWSHDPNKYFSDATGFECDEVRLVA